MTEADMKRKEYGEISFGEWLQDELREREITQAELARRAGYTLRAVNRICREHTSPSLFTAEMILQSLGYRFEIVEDERKWPGARTEGTVPPLRGATGRTPE